MFVGTERKGRCGCHDHIATFKQLRSVVNQIEMVNFQSTSSPQMNIHGQMSVQYHFERYFSEVLSWLSVIIPLLSFSNREMILSFPPCYLTWALSARDE